ncbi:MAG: hypothetical protein ACPGJE_08145 [Wenzhouxiangellaceae bacterium]
MHKSPEPFAADLAAEQRLCGAASERSSEPPELAADRALRDELRALDGAPKLPPALREKILRAAAQRPQAHASSPWTGGWLALAAAVTLVLVVSILLQSPDLRRSPSTPAVGPAEVAELRLALNTLEDSGRRVAALTSEQVAPALRMPRVRVDRLPYAPLVFRLFGDRSMPQPQPVTKEYPQ